MRRFVVTAMAMIAITTVAKAFSPQELANRTLTPTPDAIYLMTLTKTKDVGPVVIDVPPADYPLSQVANPRETIFTEAMDVLFYSTIRYGVTFLQA